MYVNYYEWDTLISLMQVLNVIKRFFFSDILNLYENDFYYCKTVYARNVLYF